MIKGKVRGSVKFPSDLDWSKELDHIGNKIIIDLIEEGIDTNTDIFGRRHPKLAPSTRAMKGHGQPLIDTRTLKKAFKYRPKGLSKGEVYITSNRRKIAEYLQEKGVGRAKKKFEFFGITDGAEREIDNYLEKRIKDLIKDARPTKF